MKLYHTSDREIRNPDIHYGRKNADFGWGFYLTTDKDFTYRWAKENAVVNVYELDETDLNIHSFSRTTDWFQYIFDNRRARDKVDTDVIIGPIANDTIFETMGVISSGFIEPDDALKLLMIGPEYTQVAIKTEKAVTQLRFISSEHITRISAASFKAEQDAYQVAFASEMVRIMGE